MPQPEPEKITVPAVMAKKSRGEKISAVTAYDFPTARIASDAGMDIVLVGDSLGMVLQGHKNTLQVTLDDIVYHTAMVARAEPRSLVVADMPFASFHVSPQQAAGNAIRCIQTGGAEAVKLEGGRKRFTAIQAILNADIPVMGHLGLTPQSIHCLGGFKVQGKLRDKAREIFEDALELERLGVFAVVLESMPLELASRITAALKVPTIGIGAGPHCDGQVLVFHDLIGFTNLYLPRFVRRYADVYTMVLQALESYKRDVEQGEFPGPQESYHLKDDIEEFFK
jgi:3-methyl-2-oxobutanoate hydroxymethyltransferase